MNLFLSDNHQQSAYWANQLSFERRDWSHIREEHDVYGIRGPEVTVYYVGTSTRRDLHLILDELDRRGATVVCAEEMVPCG